MFQHALMEAVGMRLGIEIQKRRMFKLIQPLLDPGRNLFRFR